MPILKIDKKSKFNIKISVVIAVRNEAKNIEALLKSLSKQTYSNFEVIFIDDASTDNTSKIINNFQPNFPIQIIRRQATERGKAPKKEAIALGIKEAQGSWIVTTDGDCIVPKNWLANIAYIASTKQIKLISGLVCFYEEKSFFEKIQAIEFSSLVSSGAVSMYLKKPNMCNGANLAYEKAAFNAVDGFEGINDIASGDDELLLKKINKKYPKKIYFLKSRKHIVQTKAQTTLYNFYQQRKRWASKWDYTDDLSVKILAIFIFLVNFGFLISAVFSLVGLLSIKTLLIQVFLKFGIEIVYLSFVLHFLNKSGLIILIPVLQIIYPFYVVFFGILANFSGGYQWKDTPLK